MDGRAVWDASQWLVAGVAFAAGCRRRRQALEPDNFFEGSGYFEETIFSREESGGLSPDESTQRSLRVGAPLKVPVAFKLTLNPWAATHSSASPDRPEIPRWLDGVDVSCKDPSLRDVLGRSTAASAAIGALMKQGVTMIAADGDTLWIHRSASDLADNTVVARLFELRDALALVSGALQTSPRGFRAKSILLEGTKWFFVSFALTNLLQMLVDDDVLFVDFFEFLRVGILVSLVLVAAVAGVVFAMFGRSLDLSGVFYVSATLFLIGLVGAGLSFTSVADRYLDGSPPAPITKSITNLECHKREIDTAVDLFFDLFRGPPCYIVITPTAADSVSLPEKIQLPASTIVRARTGQNVEFQIGRGWLGVPWYRSIRLR